MKVATGGGVSEVIRAGSAAVLRVCIETRKANFRKGVVLCLHPQSRTRFYGRVEYRARIQHGY